MMALENLGEFKVISGSPNIYTVITSSKPLRTSSRQSQSQMPFVTIHNIRSLVAGENNKLLFSVDDIVTAVSIGWEMVPGGKSAPSLKFHEETKLLIVRGNRDELRIAEDVLDKLNESQRRELQKEEADKNNQLKIQLEMLRKQVKDLQGINKMLQAKLDDKTHKEINK
jgi:hypothetical protein